MYAIKINGSYIRPLSRTRVIKRKHSIQGGNPYPVKLCQMVISMMWQNGEDLRAPQLMQLCYQRKFPSLPMCKRWICQYQAEGNVQSKRASGNAFATREVHRQDLVNLALYWMVYQRCTFIRCKPTFTIAMLRIPCTLNPKYTGQSFDSVSFGRMPPKLLTWPIHPPNISIVTSIGIKHFWTV